MANLHAFTVQEALNAQGSGGQWTVNTVVTAAAADGTATNLDVSVAHQLGVYAYNTICYKFSNADSGTVSSANDLILPGRALVFLTIPKGVGESVYFNYTSSTTATPTVRTVEV